mgnify:FL=1
MAYREAIKYGFPCIGMYSHISNLEGPPHRSTIMIVLIKGIVIGYDAQ